jgi:signal transduction histidine kinase
VVVRFVADGPAALVAISAAGASGSPATGMRLAIVRRLLELHGGSVATIRGDDRGPTLTLKLPLA